MEECIEIIKDANPDAILVSDFGILRLLRKYMPDVDIHVSTQTNILNYECVKFWKDMGATRVVLARELSIPEIAEIKNKFLILRLNVLYMVLNVCRFPADVC